MADYLLFNDLTPELTLQLIANYLDDNHALPELCNDFQVRKVEDDRSQISWVTLIYNYGPNQDDKKKNQALDIFIREFNAVRDKKDGPVPITGEPFRDLNKNHPLPVALPELLKTHALRQDLIHSQRPSDLIEYPLRLDQKLLIVWDLPPETTLKIFQDLRFYTTQVKSAFSEKIIAGGSRQYFFYHVKNDKSRGSDFESALKAGLFDKNSVLLDCYFDETSQQLIALPETIVPHRAALKSFCHILLKRPDFFEGVPPTPHTQFLAAALPPYDGVSGVESILLHTCDLQFYEDWQVAPYTASLTAYAYLALQNSKAELQKLRQRVQDAKPHVGYQLELRRSNYKQSNGPEYERLLLEQNKIENRLIELASLNNEQPRPKLFRFTQNQLPILADVLRSYNPANLSKLRYGYYASDQYHPEGLHFIYVEPEIEMTELDPLVWWGEKETQPIEFWLDPHWAYHYQGASQSKVFVPHGLRLYPSLHSWEAETMDAYLRKVLNEHFRGHGSPDILDHIVDPIYLFDGVPGRNKSIYLTILDKAKFARINSPDNLDWLNENLYVLEEIGTKTLIKNLAEDYTGSRIRRNVKEMKDEVSREFEQYAEKFVQTVTNETHGVIGSVNTELTAIIGETTNFITDANELNERLKKLLVLYGTMRSQAQITEDFVKTAWTEMEALDKRFTELTETVTTKINDAEAKRIQLEARVNNMVSKLETTQTALLKRVQDFKNLLLLRPKNTDQRSRLPQSDVHYEDY